MATLKQSGCIFGRSDGVVGECGVNFGSSEETLNNPIFIWIWGYI